MLNVPTQEIITDGVVDTDKVEMIVKVNGVEIQKKSVVVINLEPGTKCKVIAKLFTEEYRV